MSDLGWSRRRVLSAGAAVASVAGAGAWLFGCEAIQPASARARKPGYAYLRGVNFTGMQYTPGERWPVSRAVDYYVGQKKMNVVRLPLLWELVQPQLNGPLDPAQTAGIADQVLIPLWHFEQFV